MYLVKLSLLFTVGVLTLKAQDFSGADVVLRENRRTVDIVVRHLNQVPKERYVYKQGRYVDSQLKGDILQLVADFDVTCKINHPGVPCKDITLQCTTFLRKDVDDYKVISYTCSPKSEISAEQSEISPTLGAGAPEAGDNIELSHEAIYTDQKADFVAVKSSHVPCLGCPFDLSPNADGVTGLITTALRHLESERDQKHSLVKVVRLQEQIVAGVKYFLILEVSPTTCPKHSDSNDCPIDTTKSTETCEIIYFQKPWLSPLKHIIKNNCTVSQAFPAIEEKIIKERPQTTSDLSDLESQIIPDQPEIVAPSHLRPYKPQSIPKINEIREPTEIVPEYSPSYITNEEIATENVDIKVESITKDTSEIAQEYTPASNVQEDAKINEQIREKRDTDEDTNETDESKGSRKQRNRKDDTNETDESDSDAARHKRDTHEDTDETNETDDSDEKLVRRKRDDDSDSSSSSSSDSDDDDNNCKSKKRCKNNDSSSSSSSSSSDSDDDSKSRHSCKHRHKDDSSSSSSDDSDDDKCKKHRKHDSSSSSSSSDSEDDNRIKSRKHKSHDDDSSSSSSSSSSDSDDNDKKRKSKKHDDDSSSSSSNSSCDDDNDDDNTKTKCDNNDDASKTKCNNGTTKKHDADQDENLDSNGEDNKNSIKKTKHSNDDDQQVENWPKKHYRKGYEVEVTRKKRSVGTYDSMSEEDKMEVKKLAKIAAKMLNHTKSTLKILSAEKVEMDGSYYKLRLHLDTVCRVIMHVDRNSEITMVKSQCQDKEKYKDKKRYRRFANIPGGIVPVSVTPEMKGYLKDALVYLDTQSSHPNKLKVVEIVNATSQVVAGQLIRIQAVIAPSDCVKTDLEKDVEECGLLDAEPKKVCNFKIWSRPWLPNGRETSISCDGEDKVHSFKAKRSADFSDDSDGEIDTDYTEFELFSSFIARHDKNYKNKYEFNYRFRIFKDNLNTILLLNKFEQGTGIYGITKFADMTKHEFSRSHGLRTDLRVENEVPFAQAKIPDIELPTEFDWRKQNAVTEVKDQGQCGSCWAFSTTGSVEGQYAIKYKKLLEFSEQELVDCDSVDQGCNGGLMDNAYRVIEKLGGLELENDYPYEAEDEKCHFDKSKTRVQLSGALNISHDETDMAKWLVANGPISIAINANAMQFYVGGVSHPWKMLCNPNSLDHGVLIVGYGEHKYKLFNKTLPYWIVKNSWGKNWGEQGYYRVYRGDGTCGVNQTPSSAIVA